MGAHVGKTKDIKRIQQEATRRRLRDFVILSLGGVGVLALLFATNSAFGLVDMLMGAIVMLAGAMAYYVGSAPTEAVETQENETPKTKSPPKRAKSIGPFILTMPFPAILVDTDSRVRFANEYARRVFRFEEDASPLISAALRQPDLLSAAARVAKTAAGEQVEFNLRDDAETWLAHMQSGSEDGTVIIVLEDMTAVRRAERARADFLANASHELRTPLTAIGGFVETMRGPAKDDKGAWDGFMEIIQQQTERMKRLVADLLSLSRIEFSEHRPPSTPLDISNLVSRASMSLQPIAAEHKVKLKLEIDDTALNTIADADEMMQVVQNIAGNAIKYAPEGGTVTLQLGRADTMADAASAAGGRIIGATRALITAPRASNSVPAFWLRVADNGVGIPAAHLPRLGERFYRADESRGGEIEGTGLGLAIVKHIMARHRGGFQIESLEGTGTAAGIWMPLIETASETTTAETPAP